MEGVRGDWLLEAMLPKLKQKSHKFVVSTIKYLANFINTSVENICNNIAKTFKKMNIICTVLPPGSELLDRHSGYVLTPQYPPFNETNDISQSIWLKIPTKKTSKQLKEKPNADRSSKYKQQSHMWHVLGVIFSTFGHFCYIATV